MWWETPLYLPAHLAEGLRGVFRSRLGTARLHEVVEQACMDALEWFDREGRQHGMLCPCAEANFTADPRCEICWGAGFIWLDNEGNVIGNAEESAR